MDNYTIAQQLPVKTLGKRYKYHFICTCCGRGFWSNDPLREVCDCCTDEFSDILADSYSMEFEEN